MGNSIKLSNSNYLRTCDMWVPYNSQHYNFDDWRYEMQWGTVHVADNTRTKVTTYTVTFPKAFSARPYVIICDSTDKNGHFRASTTMGVTTTTTTNFTVSLFDWSTNIGAASGTWNRIAISYIALVPKQDFNGQATSPRAGEGTWKLPDATTITGAKALKLSSPNYWDTSAFVDTKYNKLTGYDKGTTLKDTYAEIQHGTITGWKVADKTDGVTTFITYPRKFKQDPVVIACMALDGTSTVDLTASAQMGKFSISTRCNPDLIDAEFDIKEKCEVHAWSYTGASRTINVNWIAIGGI